MTLHFLFQDKLLLEVCAYISASLCTYLKLMKKDAESDSLEMSGELGLLWSQVVEYGPSSDRSARSAKDEFKVLEPSEGGGEHVHPGSVPPRPRLHANAHVEVFAPEGAVAVMLLVN